MIDNESGKNRQRIASFSSMDKGKGSVVNDADEIEDDIDPEDAEYILMENDLIIIDEIRA